MTKIAVIGECMAEMQPLGDGLYRRAYAGDTFNMAQYLTWLGADKDISVSYVTVLGDDKFGNEMLVEWKKNGLDTTLVMQSKAKKTGLYFADLDEKGDRDYSFYRADSAATKLFKYLDFKKLNDLVFSYNMIYTSAISLMILKDSDRKKMVDLFAVARSKGITTAFDTNYRKTGWKTPEKAARWMTRIMGHCDIVLPTFDENKAVFGDQTPEATIYRIKALGVKEIAVRCGADKCVLWHDNRMSSVPALPGIKVVDTTSAGDLFSAAYLCARLQELPPETAAKHGHILAAEVIQHRGAIIPKEKLPVF